MSLRPTNAALGLVFLSLFALAAAGAGAQENAARAKLVAERHPAPAPGYARLIFDFDDRPNHKIDLADGVLRVFFDRAVRVDLTPARTRLQGFIIHGRRLSGDRQINFVTDQRLRFNAQVAENSLYIDLLPHSRRGPPPALPQPVLDRLAFLESRSRAVEPPPIPVDMRVDFVADSPLLRLIIAPETPEGMEGETGFQRRGDRITVSFPRTIAAKLAELKIDPPPQLVGVHLDDDGTKLHLDLAPDHSFRAFRDEGQPRGHATIDIWPADGDDLIAPEEMPSGKTPPEKMPPEKMPPEKIQDLAESAPVGDEIAGDRKNGERLAADLAEAEAAKDLAANDVAADDVADDLADDLAADDLTVNDIVASALIATDKGLKFIAEAALKIPHAVIAAMGDADATPPSSSSPGIAATPPSAPASETSTRKDAIVATAAPPRLPPNPERRPTPSASEKPMPPASEKPTPPASRESTPPASGVISASAPKSESASATRPASKASSTPKPRAARAAAAPSPDPHPPESRFIPDLIPVAATFTERGLDVEIAFDAPVAAAVFSRRGIVWALFDTQRGLDISELTAKAWSRRIRVDPIIDAKFRALRFAPPPSLHVGVEADGHSWRLRFDPDAAADSIPLTPLTPEAVRTDRIEFSNLPETVSVVRLHDVEIGERLVALLHHAPTTGLYAPQRYVAFDLPATHHGLAIRPHMPDIDIASERGSRKLRISRQRGLFLSAADIQSAEAVSAVESYFRNFGKSFGEIFPDAKRETLRNDAGLTDLFEDIAVARGEDRIYAQLAAIRALTAIELYPEARAQLDVMASEDEKFFENRKANLLYAALQQLGGRPNAALQTLEKHKNQTRDRLSADERLWRSAALADLERYDEAQSQFIRGRQELDAYPPWLQAMFLIRAAEVAVGLDNPSHSRFLLDRAAVLKSDIVADPLFRLVEARLNDRVGLHPRALADYDMLVESPQTPESIRVRAAYRRLSLLRRLERIDLDQSLDGLLDLAASWRGDRFEVTLLRRIAELNLERRNYRNALESLKKASTSRFADRQAVPLVETMADIFKEIYLGTGADAMSAAEALALYYDFSALTPPGAVGDRMIRRLAERLIEIDLLDQAVNLLNHQADQRSTGGDRAEIGARIAEIHLLDRAPDSALAALRRTRSLQTPPLIKRRRTVVEIRTLAELERYDDALFLLEESDHPQKSELNAELLWRKGDWNRAAQAYLNMLGLNHTPSQRNLNSRRRNQILRAGVALILAGDDDALKRFVNLYGDAMKNSPDADAFGVIARSQWAQGKEFRSLAADLAAVEPIETWLQTLTPAPS